MVEKLANFRFKNQGLPKNESYFEAMLALAKLELWFTSDAEFLTLDTDAKTIIALNSVKPSSTILAQANPVKRAMLEPDLMNGEPAIQFTRGEVDHYRLSALLDASANFSVAMVWRSALGSQIQGVASTLVDGSNRFGFQVTGIAGQGQAYLGPTPATINFVNTPGKIVTTVLAKKADTFRIRHDGVQSAPVAHTNATGNDFWTIAGIDTDNSAAAMDMGDLWFFPNDDILDHPPTMAAIEAYVGNGYDIAI